MLQHVIDHKWAESRMYLILCGSSVSFMESQVLGQESPLYGRRTGQFKIEPLDYKETAVFHPKLSAEDNSLIYGITGVNNGELVPSARFNYTTLPKQEYRLAGWLYRSAAAPCRR